MVPDPDHFNTDFAGNFTHDAWQMATINPHFSKIDPDVYGAAPNDTNVNETAHRATNDATGINLPLDVAFAK